MTNRLDQEFLYLGNLRWTFSPVMSLFKKIFKSTSKSETRHSKDGGVDRGKYMPEINEPADERFTKNFIANGGKLIYNITPSEIQQSFDNILLENDWYEQQVYCWDEHLIDTFKGYNLDFGIYNNDAPFFLTTCESLIADNGSILVCSKQLKEKKINEFPINIVVYATTSQIVNNIGEGLRIIKDKTKGRIPSNITTIKNFQASKDEKDFMSYGSSTKNLYLLLLEDL